ncbi:MAG: diguanylate cyclase [Pseudomonadota bacterium]
MASIRAATAIVFAFWISAIDVSALDGSRQPSQFIHSSWSRADGLPAESVWDVFEDQDGYLWIGTEGGLVRFDGIKFKVFNSNTHAAFRADDVRSVAQGPSGEIWASTYGGGLIRLVDDIPSRIDKNDGLLSDVVYSVTVTSNGDVWAGTAIGVCRLRDDLIDCWDKKDGVAGGRIFRIAEDAQGRVWMGAIDGGLSSFDGVQFKTYGPENGLTSQQIFLVRSDPVYNVLVGAYDGSYYRVTPEGLVRLDTGALPEKLAPLSALRDRHENLWVGMNGGGGLWRMKPEVQRLDNPEHKITHIFGLTEDRYGGLWVATSAGLHHYREGAFMPWGAQEGVADGSFVVEPSADANSVWVGTEGTGLFHVSSDSVTRFGTEDGLPSSSVSALYLDSDDSVWVGTFGGGFVRMKNGQLGDVIDNTSGLPDNQVTAFHRDSTGAMWIGTSSGLARWHQGAFTHTLSTEHGLLSDLVRHLAEDRMQRLLIASDSGLTRLSLNDLQVIDTFDRRDGLVTDVVATTYVDRAGVTWLGHRSGGLARLSGSELFVFERHHELGIDSIMTIVEDYEGYLWLGGRRGIVRVNKDELEDVAAGRTDRVISSVYSENDGLRSVRVPGGFKSASTRTRDGRVWFATARGLAVVDPRHLPTMSEPLDIVIESIEADGIKIQGDGVYRIPANTQTVQIDYTVPRLHDAESLQFRYRLNNGEDRWLDAGKRRTAFFTSLPPRLSTFEVAVAREGQPFEMKDAQNQSVVLFVEPLWYQTYIARVGAIFALMMLTGLIYLLALRRYRHRQRRLEELVNERTEALQEALGAVERISRTDVLTQVANRRHFRERFEEEWQRSIAQSSTLGLMMIDIDFFKDYNDIAGHQAGDECLKAVAQALSSKLRSNDFVARYGGEEFVVLLSDSNTMMMRRICRRLQSSVRELKRPHPARPGTVLTVSAGFATSDGGSVGSREALIRLADEALYMAKNRGRDCLVVNGDWVRATDAPTRFDTSDPSA